MPSGGVHGQSGNKDGNVGALRAPACPQHRGYYGGRKLPTPTVRPVQHASPPAGVERVAPGHITVSEGDGTEEMTSGVGEDAGEYREGLRGLLGAYKECVGFNISGESSEGGRRRLAGGGWKPG